MAVSFSYNATTVTPSRAYKFPVAWPRRRVQGKLELAAGSMRVQDLGTEVGEITVVWDRLPKADVDQLVAFWRLVGGAAQQFSFTDADGVLHTVRWTNDFQSSIVGYQLCSLTIVLREEI